MKNLSLFVFVLMVLGCEEPIIINTDSTPNQYIIEGLITNEEKQHTIRISQTVDFYTTGQTPKVSGASVIVTDNLNNQYTFTEDESGIYKSEIFQGQVGSTYNLEVIIENEVFSASEELLPITTIDSLTKAEADLDNSENNNLRSAYSVFLYTKEPQDEDNYYLFKFYRNGEVLNEDGEDITVTDDVAVGEAIEGIEAPYLYLPGDTARIEMYSLTRDAFVFWNDVASLIFSDGGVFAPLPANPRSNITGGVLGVFQVSAVESANIYID